MKKYILSLSVAIATPLIAFAQVNNADSLFELMKKTLGQIMPILIGLAVLYFVYGVLKYIMNAGDEDEQKKGRSLMVNGIIAIFVMVSVWGLVRILTGTFIFETAPVSVPILPSL